MAKFGFGFCFGAGKRRSSGTPSPAIALSANTVSEAASSGTTIGTLSVSNGGTGWTFAITSQTPAGKTAISSADLNTAAALDYDTNATLSVTITASKSGETDIVQTLTIHVLAVLGALALDSYDWVLGTPASGAITGAHNDEVITLGSGWPSGLSVDSAARTWAYDGSGSDSSGSGSLIGTHPQATNSPHTTSGLAWTLAAAGLTSSKRVLFIGDSTMVGVGAGSGGSTDVNGSRPYSMPLQAAARLAARGYSVATETFVADQNNGVTTTTLPLYRTEVTLVSALSTASDSPQIGGLHTSIGVGGNVLTYTTSAACDRLDILIHRRSDFGVLGLSVDGGAVQNISLVNATEDLALVSITGLSLATHSFAFTRVSGTVRVPVYWNAYDSTVNAFHIFNCGARNWTSTDWVVTGHPNSPLTAISYIVPDVVVLDLGINDWRQSGTTIATFKANMQTIIDACLAANPDCKVILSIPHDIQTYVTTTDAWSMAAARQAYVDLATTNSLPMVDGPHEIALAGLSGGVDPATFAAVNAAGYMHDSLHSLAPPYQARGYAQANAVLTALGLT